MKAILGVLLSFVFIQSQAFALSGGPEYPGNSQNIQGIYAGVLIPSIGTAASSANTLGLFSFTVPQSGLSSGDFMVFVAGITYSGSINGFADPDKLTMKGVLDATDVTTIPLDPLDTLFIISPNKATGEIKGTFDRELSGIFGTVNRLNGTAHLDVSTFDFNVDTWVVDPDKSLDMTVDGLQQTVAGGQSAG